MKKIVSLAAVLMLVAVSSAFAGLNGSWDDCGINGVAQKTVTCTNSATALQKFYCSFVLVNPMPTAASSDANVDMQSPNTLGSWWLGGSARFQATEGPATCPSWYGGAAHGGVQVGPNITQTSPSRLRLRVVTAVATGEEQALDNVTEYFNHTIDIKFGAGTFANPECVAGAAFRFVGLLMQQPGNVNPQFENTLQDNDCGTFRTGPAAGCAAATPTHKSTWGSIKALYR